MNAVNKNSCYGTSHTSANRYRRLVWDLLFTLRRSSGWPAIFARYGIVLLASVSLFPCSAYGDRPFMNSRLPTGEVGRFRIMQRPELSGVTQPVLLKVPKGASVSVAEGAGFSYGEVDATLVGLSVGETYRLKVSNIPNNYGDVYPTVELIDRLHAPAGKETRYPIPIDITEEELRMALRGKFITRVIYVEDPRRALGVRDVPDRQRYFEVMAHEDPLHVASRLGRPVAILRMGSLAPSSSGPSVGFLFGSPSFQRHVRTVPAVPYQPSSVIPTDSLELRPDRPSTLPEPLPITDADDGVEATPELPQPEIESPVDAANRTDDLKEADSEPLDDELFSDDGAGDEPAAELSDEPDDVFESLEDAGSNPFEDDLTEPVDDSDPFDSI